MTARILNIVPWAILLVVGTQLTASPQKNDQTAELLTGKQLQEKLALAVSAWWSDGALKSRLTEFSQSQRVGLFLDRRVDSQRQVSLGLQDRTLEQLLWQVAEDHELAICRVDDFYYIGPSEPVARLPVIVDELGRETMRQRRKFKCNWNQKVGVSSGPVVNPQALLQSIGRDQGFQINGLESVPHDTWSRVELPPSRLTSTVQVLLTGFGKTFTRSEDGTVITVVDMPETVDAKREFERPAGLPGAEFRTLLSNLQREFPELNIRGRGKRISVSGDIERMRRLESRLVASQRPVGLDSGRKTYTLARTTEFRGTLLVTIAQQSSREIVLDPSLRSKLNERISIEANNDSLEELLFKVLSGSGLKAELAPGKLIISAK